MNFSVTKTFLALGFAGTLAGAASAQLPTTYTQGDFLLGFRQTGTSDSVVIDLGPISSFNTSQEFSINAGATLTNEFGSGWATDPTVFFSLASTNPGYVNTVTSAEYLTGPNAGAAKVWTRSPTSTERTVQNDINNLGGEFTSAGVVEPKTDANAYQNFMPGGTTDAGHATAANIAFGQYSPTTEGNFGQGTAGVELDTIQIAPGTGKGTEEGDFSISADGNTLTFSPVPEPSPFAAMAAIGALALLSFTRKMKVSKTLLGATALLLGMTGLASAQTKIYIVGATAFRATINNQIDTLLGYPGNGIAKASDNATFTSANVINWTGGKIGGTPVTIKVSYSGAASGIQQVAGAPNFTVGFLPDGATGTSNADPRVSSNPHESAVPDIVTSIVYQGTTPFNGTFQGINYATLTDNVVAVQAITFAGSKGFPSNLSVTPQIAQKLFPGGIVPLSEFTGADSDLYTGVIATGRNADGGTRLNTMAETNVGVNTTLSQFQPTISNGQVTSLQLYPPSVINGIGYGQGDGGESSDSTLRTFLPVTVSVGAAQQVDSTLTGGFLVTYIGVSDFNAVSSQGAVAINYNGVPESQLGIEEGSYTLWGYAHIDYRSTLGNGSTGGPAVKLTFATDLVNQILGATSQQLSPNVALSDMKVNRPGDGGIVASLYH